MSKNSNMIEQLQSEAAELRSTYNKVAKNLRDVDKKILKLQKEDFIDKFTDLNLDDCNEDLRLKLTRELTSAMFATKHVAQDEAHAFFRAWLQQSSPLFRTSIKSYSTTMIDDVEVVAPVEISISGNGNYSAEEITGIEAVIKKLQFVAGHHRVLLDFYSNRDDALVSFTPEKDGTWLAYCSSSRQNFSSLTDLFAHDYTKY